MYVYVHACSCVHISVHTETRGWPTLREFPREWSMFQRVLQLPWCVLKDMYEKVSCSRWQDISGSGRALNLQRMHNVRRMQVFLGKGWTLCF